MSLEPAERYMQELEAIKNYAQVKRERGELSKRVEELKVSLDSALKEVSSLKGLKTHLGSAEMTLEEARLDFMRAQDAEIEKRAADRLKELKADYESKMPQLVYQRLRDILRQPLWPEEIAELIGTEAKSKADAILREQDNWPQWFRELYQEEVKKKVDSGLNQEFDSRVETAASARAQQRLKELTNTEWPTWYRANVEPKIVALGSKIHANALQLLKGPWVFTCHRCQTEFDAELTAKEIEQLLRSGQIKVECANQQCQDHSLFSTRRHTFQLPLRDLIAVHVAG